MRPALAFRPVLSADSVAASASLRQRADWNITITVAFYLVARRVE